jgi:hypothetical protein
MKMKLITTYHQKTTCCNSSKYNRQIKFPVESEMILTQFQGQSQISKIWNMGFCFLVVCDCWLTHINLMQWQDFVLLLINWRSHFGSFSGKMSSKGTSLSKPFNTSKIIWLHTEYSDGEIALNRSRQFAFINEFIWLSGTITQKK